MNFEKFFKLISYAAVFCGFFALWVSGTFGFIASGLFVTVVITAWMLEGSRWQISEWAGTSLIVLALPAFYLAWRFQIVSPTGGETWIAGILARMILCLAAVKLLQKKSDRDWIFLYLMSFFEVLLAAGLSISPLYLASFLLYILLIMCSIIAFEIRKTSRVIERKIIGAAAKNGNDSSESSFAMPIRRLPTASFALILFMAALALPIFFVLPRDGGAGFGGGQSGLSTSSGFSDVVRLGGIGRIQESDEIVMRVKLDSGTVESGLYFRGVALDTFDNQSWSKSKPGPIQRTKNEDREVVQLDFATSRETLLIQTIFLEPMDTPILFAVPRAVGIQGSFSVLEKDAYGSLSFPRDFERISYKVISDRSSPPANRLRLDDQPYTAEVQNYRDLPPIYDIRIAELAEQITAKSTGRYEKARDIEAYLQTKFGYTLEQKAGGREPLSDFLFNVREGHCEYFATAMAVMLRTQGIATRIVNGFHGGEYNDTADVTVVRQRNAHSWVEVYFPQENAWVTFDPTPVSGQIAPALNVGFAGTFTKYIEALDAIWIQYFVAFDDQGQQSLARSMRNGLADYKHQISTFLGNLQAVISEWWTDVRGDKGLQTSLVAIAYGVATVAGLVIGIIILAWISRKLFALSVWRKIWDRIFRRKHASIVEFYDRMQEILSARGFVREPHQTPLEFAFGVGLPEAETITDKYHRVRFGGKDLTADEATEIEELLNKLKD